jgi:hypothetical protein
LAFSTRRVIRCCAWALSNTVKALNMNTEKAKDKNRRHVAHFCDMNPPVNDHSYLAV